MKRISLVIIIIILCLLITGCRTKSGSSADTGQPAVQAVVPTEQPAAEKTADAVMPAAPSVIPEEQQKQLIMDNYSLWAYTEPWDSPWFYTFTDLDHNGRLEILAAVTEGTGIFTYVHFYEVTADGSGIENCYHANEEIEGPDDWPEIILEALPCYYDAASGSYYYPCEGITRDGVAHQYYSWSALCLKNGVAEWEPLAYKWVDWDEQAMEHVSCQDASGNVITEQDYDSAVERRFAGMEKSKLELIWTQMENPWPEEDTAAVSDAPAGPQVVITKNPTSEAIAIGGKTWFIAHADNAGSLTWKLAAPDNTIYYSLDSAMALHPGLKLEALEGDTLAVSNVPLSVNGWGVVALFENGSSSAVTEPAYLYVGDFLTAYSSVIDEYRAAYAQGEGRFEYAMEHDLSEVVRYSTGVGYALKDLDKNGIPELIIEGIGTDDFSEGIAYGIYTLVNNQPVNIATSWARNRYYICTDNTILNEGSGGAGHSVITVYRLSGQALMPLENLMTYFDGNERDGYYRQTGSLSWDPQPGDQKIDGDTFQAGVEQLESKIYTPLLTRIG